MTVTSSTVSNIPNSPTLSKTFTDSTQSIAYNSPSDKYTVELSGGQLKIQQVDGTTGANVGGPINVDGDIAYLDSNDIQQITITTQATASGLASDKEYVVTNDGGTLKAQEYFLTAA